MRPWWVVTAVVSAFAVTLGLIWFQPWKLVLDRRVTEALPSVAVREVASTRAAPQTSSRPVTTGRSANGPTAGPNTRSISRGTTPPADVLLARGSFVSHEHETSGTVSVVRLADGRRVLAIADLSTSDGPDVHVWLTNAPVLAGKDGWYVFDDRAHISLGTLKGNLGDQVYAIPRSADLALLTSVTLWCDRFDVSFGAAQLHSAG